ncbi:hypothetical protein EX30DRAFT_220779 [Ascodesmis nigricans]|uniref:Uncharacterized protein n=1 Tax=Ascodesmis nigricans TaxID=341454 RepID=A0A4S2N034_9PEZI|nr:hypothetical protein EX30DRAFT_220779 [Ascodesmis nigricans]
MDKRNLKEQNRTDKERMKPHNHHHPLPQSVWTRTPPTTNQQNRATIPTTAAINETPSRTSQPTTLPNPNPTLMGPPIPIPYRRPPPSNESQPPVTWPVSPSHPYP